MTIDDKLSTTTMFTYDGDRDFSGFLFYDNTNKYMVNDRGEIIDNNSVKFGLEKESYVRRIGLNIGEVGETQSDKNKNRMVYVNKEILVGEVGILYDENTLMIEESTNGEDWKDKYYVEFIDLNANKKIQLVINSDLNSIVYSNESGYNVIKETTGINFNITDDNNGNKVVYAYRSRNINNNEFVNDNSTLLDVHLTTTVLSIGTNAFNGCIGLKEVRISSNVKIINTGTFYGCIGLEKITIPEGVTSIGDDAFYGCTSLIQVTIPEGVTSINDDAFYGCISLIQVTIPNSMEKISVNAFKNCTGLKEVTIPNNVETIGANAFDNCKSLTKIIIIGLPTNIGKDAFTTNSLLTIYCNETTKRVIAEAIKDTDYKDNISFVITTESN